MEPHLIECIQVHMRAVEPIDRDATLLDLGYDSFKFIELVLIVEQKFAIEFADEDLSFRKFSRVSDLLTYIEGRKAAP